MSNQSDRVVVKIQQSLYSSDSVKSVLVYDKDRTVFFQSEDPKIVNPLVERLGDEPKKYFKAAVAGKELKLYEEMKDETW